MIEVQRWYRSIEEHREKEDAFLKMILQHAETNYRYFLDEIMKEELELDEDGEF